VSKLSRLQTKLTKVQARITEIEAAYPTISKFLGYSSGQGQLSTQYQQFGPVAQEYRQLLTLQESIEDQIAAFGDDDDSGSAVAAFREVQT
jgi:hypothetical protein